MNFRILFFITPLGFAAAAANAADKQPEAPVPVLPSPAAAPANPTEAPYYQQRLYGESGSLVAPDKARQVVEAFRTAYEKLGKPRILIYVNRELVDERGGMKLTGRKEHTETTVGEKKSSFDIDPNAPKSTTATGTPQTQVNVNLAGSGSGSVTTPGKGSSNSRSTTVTAENTYSNNDKPSATIADKQTVREVERLIGRAFRAAGASLADQKVASALIADQPLDHFVTPTNDAARKDRDALTKVADMVLEVLISSRNVPVVAVSGDQSVPVPDIQLTAIKLSDASIVGQASATDVLGKDLQAGRTAQRFDVRDITEATALALMEDIATTTR